MVERNDCHLFGKRARKGCEATVGVTMNMYVVVHSGSRKHGRHCIGKLRRGGKLEDLRGRFLRVERLAKSLVPATEGSLAESRSMGCETCRTSKIVDHQSLNELRRRIVEFVKEKEQNRLYRCCGWREDRSSTSDEGVS